MAECTHPNLKNDQQDLAEQMRDMCPPEMSCIVIIQDPHTKTTNSVINIKGDSKPQMKKVVKSLLEKHL